MKTDFVQEGETHPDRFPLDFLFQGFCPQNTMLFLETPMPKKAFLHITDVMAQVAFISWVCYPEYEKSFQFLTQEVAHHGAVPAEILSYSG